MTDARPCRQVARSTWKRRLTGAGGVLVLGVASATVAAIVAAPAAGADTSATTTASTTATSAANSAGPIGTLWGDSLANASAVAGNQGYRAAQDPGSLYTVENAIGARAVWLPA